MTNRGVRWGKIDPNETVMAPLTRQDISDLRLMVGDVLVCEGGEIGRASVWQDELPECYYQNTLHRLRPNHDYQPRLLVAFLEQWAASGVLLGLVGKSSLAHLTKENLIRVPIPVPRRSEQAAIAEVLVDVDELISKLERLIAKKQAIKQGMMQQLLTGRTRLPGFVDDWTIRRIGDFTQVRAGGTPSTSVARYWGGDIPWMSSGEVHQKQVWNVRGRITKAGLHESSAQMFPPQTVLMALAGQGKTRGTVAISRISLTTNQSIAGIYPGDGHDSDYLYYNLDSRYAEMRGESAGDGGRGGLNLTIIKALEIPFPGLDEQKAISRILFDVDSGLQVLTARMEKAESVKEGMMEQLLTGRTRLPAQEATA